jgi:hypothetical protein
MVQMRDIWAEEIEAALAGKKTAKAGARRAVERGNAMLRQFEKHRSSNERRRHRPPVRRKVVCPPRQSAFGSPDGR